jgi:hypothetical protein
MPIPLQVTAETIKSLTPDSAVNIIRDLLWSEASCLQVGNIIINVSSDIDTADGGIDAEVSGVPTGSKITLLSEGYTAYQIKSGSSFKLRTKSDIPQILFAKKAPGAPVKQPRPLLPRVKQCLERNGTFVVLVMGSDAPPSCDIVHEIIESLEKVDSAYSSAKVKVYYANTIATLLDPYPALRLKVLGAHGEQFYIHEEWSNLADMTFPLHCGDDQASFLNNLAGALRSNDSPVHVRVTGDAGVGKTRLVLEATKHDDLRSQVIYFTSPDIFHQSQVIRRTLLSDNTASAILVVDECDGEQCSHLWNNLRSSSPQIKLITIFIEEDKVPGVNLLNVPPLADDNIRKILEEYVTPDTANRWLQACSGSPRAAHILGQNLQLNPDDPLRSARSYSQWDRFIAGKAIMDDRNEFQSRKNLLTYLALFKWIGFGNPYNIEGRLVQRKISMELQISRADFENAIRLLRERKLLQGNATLHISPKILHIWLWQEWWEAHGAHGQFNIEEFRRIGDNDEPAFLSEDLLDSMFEMFRYARNTKVAHALVQRLLSNDGIFTQEVLNTEQGSRFFWSLAEADPPGALTCLNRSIGNLVVDQLLDFGPGRRNVLFALQGLAVWKNEFDSAARLLLAFAEAENESWSNNASGMFLELFWIGPGPVAATESSFSDRFPIIQEALRSESRRRRSLGRQACGAALKTNDFTRVLGVEHQGLNNEPKLWFPQTWQELCSYYRLTWQELESTLSTEDSVERAETTQIMLDRARGLNRLQPLSEMVAGTLAWLVEKEFCNRLTVLQKVLELLTYETDQPPDVRNVWIRLRETLTGSSFEELLHRYVGLDLTHERVERTTNGVRNRDSHILDLATRSVQNPTILAPELPWLMTDEAKNGDEFGHALGQLDTALALKESLLYALAAVGPKAVAATCGGYFRAIRERSPHLWEEELDALVYDESLSNWIPDLTWRSGPMSDRSADRIMQLAVVGNLDIDKMRMFAFGSAIAYISESSLNKWLRFLLDTDPSRMIGLALNLTDFYYLRVNRETMRLPDSLALELLAHPSLFDSGREFGFDTMTEYYWTELGQASVESNPSLGLVLANLMIQHIADDNTIAGGHGTQTRAVLNDITRLNPEGVWQIVVKYLDPPATARSLRIHWWLRGEDIFNREAGGAITFFQPELIWRWVDEDVPNRARIAADFIPPSISTGSQDIDIARQLLVRYGDRDDVRSVLSGNFMSRGWWGNESEQFATLRRGLDNIKQNERNPYVRRWLDDMVAYLTKSIDLALAQEEREFG